jgi:CYTH domain-containing protein/CHAD domain-containing protein
MGLEIERKFVLDKAPDWLRQHDSVEIEQGYLAIIGDAELRLRRAGDERTLTLKRGAGESREEFETPISAGQAAVLWPSTLGRLEKRRHLVPLEDGLRAEVDVYGGGLEGLAVVEVEFPDAARARDFGPPAWFGREVTGRPEYANQTLATDGLPKGERDGASPSRAYRLKRKEPVGDGLRRIAAGRADKALERLRAAEAGEEEVAIAVHGARKDLKKLRAVVRLLRPALGESAYRKENRCYREAGRALSASRDAQVKLETLDALGDHGDDLPMAALAAWRHELARDLEKTGEAGGAALDEAIELIAAGHERIDDWGLEGDWDLLAPGVRRTYQRGRRAMRRAEDDPEAATMHDWRKRAKDLWYLLRLLERVWPELLGETTEEAHRLTELLGDHHDLAVLARDLAGRPLSDDQIGQLSAAIAGRQDELAAEAFELGHRLYAEKPKAFRRRIHAYWKAWRG